ncbi:MAG: helix-turn-helix transcriptional regulator [Sphingomonas sp.]
MGQNQLPKLSPRQQQCLKGVAAHLDSQQIAHELGISPHTVDGHIAAAIAALGAHSRRDAVRLWEANARSGTDERLTGESPPVDFPAFRAPPEFGSTVREAPAPASFDEPMAHFDWQGGSDGSTKRTLRIVAVAAGLGAALAVLLLAAPQLGRDAQVIANFIQPFHQHD